MARKRSDIPEPTFEVRFVASHVHPEKMPLRAVSDALSAVQDLACGRDSFDTSHVPLDKSIGLIDVKRGSAVYSCVAQAPTEALDNLSRVGNLLATYGETLDPAMTEQLIVALSPIRSLSEIAKAIGCSVEIVVLKPERRQLLTIGEDDYTKLSKKLLVSGESSIYGKIERVGGATEMRCLMRIPGRRRLLYCDVKNRDLVRRLGQHLYENVVADGTATWLLRSWRVVKFTINGFSLPKFGNPTDTIHELRSAGMDAWDNIDDPGAFLKDMRS